MINYTLDQPIGAHPLLRDITYYRYTGKRFDPASGGYDMGFRDYQPGINRFTVRDSYNGALNDLNLGTNTWTGNRYSLAGGNPITGVEIDGHRQLLGDCSCYSSQQSVDQAVAATRAAAAENEWVGAYSPQTVDDPTQLASLWSAHYSATDRDFWRMGMGDGENACFGRKGCQEAWIHIVEHPDDVAGAKRIAATYCVDHFDECSGESSFEDAVNVQIANNLFALLGVTSGGWAASGVAISADDAYVVAMNRAQAEATKIRELPGRHTATSVALDRTTGQMWVGVSGNPKAYVPPELASRLPAKSLEPWAVTNCAEVAACSTALSSGAELGNLTVVTVRTNNGSLFPPCKNCSTWVPGG